MNAFIPIIKKDFRVLKWQCITWLILVALQTWIDGWGLGFIPRLDLQLATQSVLSAALHFARFFVLAFAAGSLVTQDPTVGSTSFWMTRPIGGLRLLASKALFCLLFLLVPSWTGRLVTSFVLGFGPGAALAHWVDGSLDEICFLIAGLSLACVVPNFERFNRNALGFYLLFLIGFFGLGIAVWVMALVTQTVAVGTFMSAYFWVHRARWIVTIFTILAGATVLANQFGWRNRRRSIGLMIAWLVLTGEAYFTCMAVALNRTAPSAPWISLDLKGNIRRDSEKPSRILADFDLKAPPNMMGTIDSVNSQVFTPNYHSTHYIPNKFESGDETFLLKAALFKEKPKVTLALIDFRPPGLHAPPVETNDMAYRSFMAQYSAWIQPSPFRHFEVIGTSPVQSRAPFGNENWVFHPAWNWDGPRVRIQVQTTHWSGSGKSGSGISNLPSELRAYLKHPKTRQLIPLANAEKAGSLPLLSSYQHSRLVLSGTLPEGSDPNSWSREAELVIVRLDPFGAQPYLSLNIKNLLIPAAEPSKISP